MLRYPPQSGSSVLAGIRFLLQSMWDLSNPPIWGSTSLLAYCLVLTPLRGSASLLTHRPMCGSDIIYNSLSPPLANIVLFGLSFLCFPSRFSKRLGNDFHTLIKNASFSSPIEVGSHLPDLKKKKKNFLKLESRCHSWSSIYFITNNFLLSLTVEWSSSIFI